MLYVGIDLGTSSVKLILMDENGKIHNTVSREYPICYPRPGWSEQNPEDWFTQTLHGIAELIADIDKTRVAGISCGGQMHGLVILDEHDEVIRPAILWNDGRTAAETDYLNNVVGKDKLSACTANIAFSGFTAPKILWLKSNEPDNYRRIRKIMLPKDYIAYKLSGAFCSDYSDASGMLLLDVQHRRWSTEMCHVCGVDEAQLPKLYESYEAVGHILPELAEQLGLSKKIVIAAGAGDNAAAAIGTGTVGNARCNISLGTSGTIFISSDTFRVDENNALHSFAHADGHYHLMGCMLSAASCNKWWLEDVLRTNDYTNEQSSIQHLGENHVFFLPYLMGERSPWNNPSARGTFTGLTMDTTRADITQAVLEGVSFAVRDMYEFAKKTGVTLSSTMICGGGAKSPLWRKMIANILNMRVDVPFSEEGPAMGAAMLAMVACGEYKTVKDAAEVIVKVAKSEEPQQELVKKYEDRYQQFRTIYPALRDVFGIISAQ